MGKKNEMPRIWRAPFSDFGKLLKVANDLQDETFTAAKAYDDGILARIADNGFNAIWVHGLLRNIVPSDVFPGLAKNPKKHIRNMNNLIERAAKHGLAVYVYMQPPRGMNADDPFWKNHPDAGGHLTRGRSDDGYRVVMRYMCTSGTEVKDFLRDSSERLAHEIPGLGGVMLITGSEYVGHCYCHFNYIRNFVNAPEGEKRQVRCPKCAKRHPADVVTEIVRLIRDGIRAVSDEAHIVVWDWAWSRYEPVPYPGMLRSFPKDIIIMSGFEQGGVKTILGKKHPINEYALSYAGPSPVFRRVFSEAHKNGFEVMAKLQISTTHELATVPSLPIIGNVYEKVKQIRRMQMRGFLGCWNFGNMLTANTAAFNFFLNAKKLKPKKNMLKEFVSSYFPGCDPDTVEQAWEQFKKAMDNYPFSVPFMYDGPINYSLAYPLKPKQASETTLGRSWQMDKRGEWMEQSLKEFTLNEVIKGLGQTAREWKKGVRLLERGLKDALVAETEDELNNAKVCYHVFRSAWNTYRVYKLRKRWAETKLSAYLKIINNELSNLEEVHPIVASDKRFGYHSEPQAYMFDRRSISKKIRSLKKQIRDKARGE